MSDQLELPDRSPSALSGAQIAAQQFPNARRGLDPDAVRQFLISVAGQVDRATAREIELSGALASLEQKAVAPQLDETALANALGSETARVIQVAHEAAKDVLAKANARALALMADVDVAADERRHVAEAESFMLTARARADAEEMVEAAKQRCQAMIDEAREARRKILADLAERRRVLHVQLEQLRAGKDALWAVVEAVGSSVDQVREQLQGSEDFARIAASDAGRFAVSEFEGVLPDELIDGAMVNLLLRSGSELALVDESGLEIAATDEGAATDPGTATDLDTTSEPPDVESPEELSPQDPPEVPATELATSSSVDELFERLRQSSEERSNKDQSSKETDSLLTDELFTDEAFSEMLEISEDDDNDEAQQGEEIQSPEQSLLARRAQLLDPHTGELARELKKTLRLEQNELLDALRNASKHVELADLVPGSTLGQHLTDACVPALLKSFSSGRAFAMGVLDGEQGSIEADIDADAVSNAAGEIADEIVQALTRKVEPVLGSQSVDELSEAVGIAFRDWRGARTEDLAGDYVTRAFSEGVIDVASERRASLRWIVEDRDGRCSECDDNALAGELPAGEEFPTGHAAPPVHRGCRCLILPSSV